MDFHRLFQVIPGQFLVLEPAPPYTILEASDAYLDASLTRREEILGRPVFEVFPDNPADPLVDGRANLEASLARVIATRAPHAMAIQKYDIRRPADAGGEFEVRYWSPVNSPLLAADGRIEAIVQRVEDVTELVLGRRPGRSGDRPDLAEGLAAERERTLRELRAVEILESITEGFFALDAEYRFTYLNDEAQRILGRPADELLGRSIWEEYPGLPGTGFDVIYRGVMEDRVARAITAYYPDHGRWYELNAYPARVGISVYFRNLTAQKEAEAERDRLAAETQRQTRIYEAALSNTPDLIYVFDLEHRFVYANEALLRTWGKTREEALGRTCLELGYEPWHAEMHDREIDEVVATHRPVRGEVPFTGTGGRRVYDYIFAPVEGPDGAVVAVAGVTRDITDRQRAEQSIREQAERLAQSDRAKDEFLATLSHELRNPLAPLRNSLALLRMGPPPDTRTANLHQMMERQVNHLVRLVDDLLEVSRITRGTLVLRQERIDMGVVVRNAAETAAPLIAEARHEIDISLPGAPLWVQGDPVRLTQVLSNLLDNAAKYTPDGGRIALAGRRGPGEVVVTVRDTGSGIAAEALEQVFEMFSRGTGLSGRGEGGLGIGLALARRLAVMHGGTLDAESEGPGRGSLFTLRLPAADSAVAALRAVRAAPGDIARHQVLVVDDNLDAGDSLAEVLRAMGAEARVARDGAEAIAAFEAFAPSVVLLDIGMPGMDGYQVAQVLRTRFPQRRAVLVALTGWGQDKDRRLAREAGFDHHLVKPTDIGALRELLASLQD